VHQLTLAGFFTPFEQELNPQNRWVILAYKLPWDEVVIVYDKQMHNGITGASHINGRVVLGALVIKHLLNLSDEETILQLQENMYMQYFIGYSGFSNEAPFDPSLFVEIRKRLGVEALNAINEKIYELAQTKASREDNHRPPPPSSSNNECNPPDKDDITTETQAPPIAQPTHEGKLLIDATACPQNIAYPTDLNILSDAREKSEALIDWLYDKQLHGSKKPHNYRQKARKQYLQTAQKKSKSKKEIRTAIGKQLRFLNRNIKTLNRLLKGYTTIPLDAQAYKYLLVIQETYRQQQEMWQEKKHSIEHRIVNIHQPHVRPIVRGKEKAKTEFGSKLYLSLTNGFAFIDHLSWESYNEGTLLIDSVEQYKRRNGVYPQEVIADKIYCTRENRKQLKDMGIRLIAKPLGRPSAVNKEHVRLGAQNQIEGKFGQAKTAYGLEKIRTRLMETSESWIASIILVLNLVKLTKNASFALYHYILNQLNILFFRKILLFQ